MNGRILQASSHLEQGLELAANLNEDAAKEVATSIRKEGDMRQQRRTGKSRIRLQHSAGATHAGGNVMIFNTAHQSASYRERQGCASSPAGEFPDALTARNR